MGLVRGLALTRISKSLQRGRAASQRVEGNRSHVLRIVFKSWYSRAL